MTLPPGWYTDLEVRRLGGSSVEELADHLVVRSPDNPTFHWGNFVLVTDPRAVDDARRWTTVFADSFPQATHVAVGLVAEPDPARWQELGIEVETEEVLESEALPEHRDRPAGYDMRAVVSDDDWEQVLRLGARPGEEDFVRATVRTRRGMVDRGVAAWFGAFHEDRLVADLGIVDCGAGTARYQSVVTEEDHRRRGIAGHLLGLAATWAADVRGCTRWVILTDVGNPAGRLYRSLGFRPTTPNAQAYRPPPRP